jgi:hypothetical protein
MEVAAVVGVQPAEHFLVRGTEVDEGAMILVTRAELVNFLTSVKAGDFDHLLDT